MTNDGAEIRELVGRAEAWLPEAPPAELWHVLEHGRLDARVGMPDVLPELGILPGPAPTFIEELRTRSWAPDPGVVDLEAWFESDANAQAQARLELFAEIAEAEFDLGGGE